MPPRKKTQPDPITDPPEAPSAKESPVDDYPENGDVFMDPKVEDESRHNYKADSKTGLPVK
jgi:hypothetical protein